MEQCTGNGLLKNGTNLNGVGSFFKKHQNIKSTNEIASDKTIILIYSFIKSNYIKLLYCTLYIKLIKMQFTPCRSTMNFVSNI